MKLWRERERVNLKEHSFFRIEKDMSEGGREGTSEEGKIVQKKWL